MSEGESFATDSNKTDVESFESFRSELENHQFFAQLSGKFKIKNYIKMKFLYQNVASGFVAGVAGLFAVFSALIMNPEQMFHWLFHPDSSTIKVERALSNPSENILLLANKIKDLQNVIIVQNRNAQERESVLIKEKNNINNNLANIKLEYHSLENRIFEKDIEINQMQDKIKLIGKQSSKLTDRDDIAKINKLNELRMEIYYNDESVEEVLQLKTTLEKAGAKVNLISNKVQIREEPFQIVKNKYLEAYARSVSISDDNKSISITVMLKNISDRDVYLALLGNSNGQQSVFLNDNKGNLYRGKVSGLPSIYPRKEEESRNYSVISSQGSFGLNFSAEIKTNGKKDIFSNGFFSLTITLIAHKGPENDGEKDSWYQTSLALPDIPCRNCRN